MNPYQDADAHVNEMLARWGGRNDFGDQNWRVILAENHMVQRAGMWTQFDEGTDRLKMDHLRSDDGSLVKYESRAIAPDRIDIGVFWVPLYPCTGWIIERWFPPAAIGSREQWESALSQDEATPMMGPYPERGMYFMPSNGGPWEEIPNLEDLRRVISQWENDPSHLHGEMDEGKLLEAMARAERDAEEREEITRQAFLKETEYAVEHNLSFIKGNPLLSGARNRIASREGYASHI